MSKKIHSEETKEELRAIIGARARAARKALSLTQEQAAETIGVSAEFYARIERCKALPSIDTLAQISHGLQVSVDHLLGFDSEITATPNIAAAARRGPKLSPQLKHIVDTVRHDPSLTRLITAILKATERKA